MKNAIDIRCNCGAKLKRVDRVAAIVSDVDMYEEGHEYYLPCSRCMEPGKQAQRTLRLLGKAISKKLWDAARKRFPGSLRNVKAGVDDDDQITWELMNPDIVKKSKII